ncbi:MAG: 3-oxoadipate enol-lactonase [Promethearchaeota archaeon]
MRVLVEKIELDSGVEIAYKLSGNPSGVPIVFVHGFAGRGAGYDPLVDRIRRDFFVLQYDQRGHGESSKPVGNTYEETRQLYKLTQFADDFRELVDKLEFPTPFVIYGHSMGGMIAQVFVLRFLKEKLVSHAVFASTLPFYGTENMRGLVAKFKSGEMVVGEETFRMMDAMGYTTKFRRQHPEIVEEELRWKLLMPPEVYVAVMENFVEDFDVRDQLQGVDVPTLVITGKRDGLVDSKNSEFIASKVPGAKLVVIPKTSHAIVRENTDVVERELRELVGLPTSGLQ